jgi:hypothetical protein
MMRRGGLRKAIASGFVLYITPRYPLDRDGCEYCGLAGLAGWIGLDWDRDGEGGENWMSR